MWPLFQTLLSAGAYYLVSETVLRGKTARRRIGKAGGAIGLIFVALWLGSLGIAALLAALFFQLANLFDFVRPALIVALITFALAGLVGLESWRLFRSL